MHHLTNAILVISSISWTGGSASLMRGGRRDSWESFLRAFIFHTWHTRRKIRMMINLQLRPLPILVEKQEEGSGVGAKGYTGRGKRGTV